MARGGVCAVHWFCLESKIRHSTIVRSSPLLRRAFCLESKIRHSTIISINDYNRNFVLP